MNSLLHHLLPIGFVVYLGVVVVLRSVLHRIRTGKSPIVVSLDDTAYGYIGRMLLVLGLGLAVDVTLFTVSDNAYVRLVPIPWLERDELRVAAIALLGLSLIWIAAAQAHMGPSFRIGIDTQNRTDLVVRGLYRFSRNPIYLGMVAALIAFLALLPNAFTLLIVGVSLSLVQVQTRLEEEHLTRLHGTEFNAYRSRVRRWL